MADDNFHITFFFAVLLKTARNLTEMTQMLLFISFHMYEYFILLSKSPKK